ncbi:ABC transporter substrate-binding protein [Enterococcus mundtii]|uniref:ABC transporter substrate-binding protein n=1 Tax=Enterococcus mundtii TaxID=53346 RepID=UPI0021B13F8F|nr:ABC transporter substrate-binding protein [Enterococcus mundtii]
MKKRMWSFVLGVSVLFGIIGCSNGDSASDAGNSGDGTVIEVVAKGFQHDFWKAVQSGAQQAADEHGVRMNFVGPKDETAIAEQLEMLNNSINKNPGAIALAALDTNAQLDAIQQAQSKGIPIIGFDSGVPDAPDGAVKATAATDNYKAGAIAAEHAYEAIKDRIAANDVSRIGIVSQEVNSLSISQRTGGFIDKMVELLEADSGVGQGKIAVTGHDKFRNDIQEKDAKVVIELRVPAEVTDAAGKTEAQALLEKSDIICVYGSNEYGAKSIINADDGLGGHIGITEDKVIAIGFDSGALQQDAIRNERFYGSVTQNPVKIGYEAVSLAVKAAKGEPASDVDTGVEWYNKDNIDSQEIQELLYQ